VFKLQQQALDLKREYDFIKDEMERMDEFLQGKYQQMMSEQSWWLNGILFGFTVIALFFTLTQLWTSTDITAVIKPLFTALPFVFPAGIVAWIKLLLAMVSLLVIPVLLSFMLLFWGVKKVVCWLIRSGHEIN